MNTSKIQILKKRMFYAVIFLLAAGVECLQYFHFVDMLGLGGNRFFRILLGSTFDIKDIGCYAAGCLILAAASHALEKRRRACMQ